MERCNKLRWVYRIGIIISTLVLCYLVVSYIIDAKKVGVSLELGSIKTDEHIKVAHSIEL